MKKQKLNKEFKDGVWYKPKMKGFIHECCDCGLKHKIDFKVFYDDKENPIEFRWNRVNTEQKPNNLSLCQSCMCMTKTIKGKCGKCGVVKQNKDREEFMARYEGANTVQSSISSFMANDIWQWIETHTKKKVEEAYKKGISDVEKNIEYNAQTKVWEIPEEKILSLNKGDF